MRARLKVCCIASIDEAALAIRLGASALGLVGRMPSGPGPIEEGRIAEIAAWAPPGVATFLLTCETDGPTIAAQVRAAGVNTVQLVDAVGPREYRVIRGAAPNVKIVQVIHVEDGDAVEEARAAAGAGAEAILLDSGRPSAAVKELGGTGRTHDWSVSRRVVEAVERPVYLAGGIRPENVREAIERVRPFGIDLCSGVRVNGRLDEARLAALVLAMR